MDPLIVCDGLVKIHKLADLETVALQGLDLVVMPGEMLGIIGPSGSGKTSLMNILGGLDRPSAGRVYINGQDLLKLSDAGLDHYRRTRVGFVWQQVGRNLVPYLSALENVGLPMLLAGAGEKAKEQRSRMLLEQVGLAERASHRLGQLSGGEQQRVAIAVALANQPDLLLADEPTGELDSLTAQAIYDLLRRFNAENGLTTIIVSHDPGLARHVDRLVSIRDGRTSTETVRRSGQADGASIPEDQVQPDSFHELIILDAAGRLQLPKEYVDHYQMQGRVEIEKGADGILIRPAGSGGQQHAEALADNLADAAQRAGFLHRWEQRWKTGVSRLRSRSKPQKDEEDLDG
jgi:ABC-type lipoprotein export system ATPase subunit